jgi:hypothetical protein
MTEQEALIESAAIGLRRAHREVSVRNVIECVKAFRGGRSYRWSVVAEILKKFGNFERGWTAPATPGQPSGNTTGNGSTKNGQRSGQQPGNLRVGDLTVLDEDRPREEPSKTTSSQSRVARGEGVVPDIPGDFEADVERLVAIDAGERMSGTISPNVVVGDRLRLRNAIEKQRRLGGEGQALAALRRGIDVALEKGLGVKYAAGVVRKFDPKREQRSERPQLELVPGGVRVPPGLSASAEATFREFARPGEDFTALSARLQSENFDAFARLNSLPPAKRQPELIAR